MLIAYKMSPHDDGTHMLGAETFRVPPEAGFFDWRFGKAGVPHPATCATCGRKTDPNYVNPKFRVRNRRRDLVATYDGFVIVSARFRDFCEFNNWHQDTEFAALPSDCDYFIFKPTRVLEFDAERRKTRFEELCPECGKYFNVIGASPVYLRNVNRPLTNGFFRSDLEFASGHEQHPLIILGIETAQAMMDVGFKKVDFMTIET